jgi:hypothetical protein
MAQSIPIFPIVKRVNGMMYSTYVNLTAGAGVVGGYVFSANGAFDPDITSTGHQPMGFDQMMLFYEQYTVMASRLRVQTVNGSATVFVNTFLYVSPDTTILTDSDRAVENGLIKRVTLGPYVGANSSKTMEISCNVPKYFGRTPGKGFINDVTVSGTAAANPSEQVYYIIATQDIARTAAISSYCNVEIEFDIYFWEPRKLTSS